MPRLIQIDESMILLHHYLAKDDTCLFYVEYTADVGGYKYSEANQKILNFKKSLTEQGQPSWRYKQIAIDEYSLVLKRLFTTDRRCVFIPIPPSKTRGHELYDDRLVKCLNGAFHDSPHIQIWDILEQRQSTEPTHVGEHKPSPADIERNYNLQLSPDNFQEAPELIVIFDDVITTGSHFKAAQSVLSKTFPTAKIIGLFLARRVFLSYSGINIIP